MSDFDLDIRVTSAEGNLSNSPEQGSIFYCPTAGEWTCFCTVTCTCVNTCNTCNTNCGQHTCGHAGSACLCAPPR